LRGVATECGDEFEGVLRFYPFRHDLQAECVSELYRRAHDRQCLGIPRNADQEALVEFQLIDWELAEVR
jgi:hypothetical protein